MGSVNDKTSKTISEHNNIFRVKRNKSDNGGIREVFFSYAGWLKIVELVFTFITLLLHRHGDHGHYLFFSTTALKLSNTDSNIDMENLGNSTLVTFTIIPLILIIGYIIDGREFIQQSILEPLWSLIGSFMFIGSGACAIMTWQNEIMPKTSSAALSEREYHRNIDAALSMGAMCIIIGLVYMCDTVVSYLNRNKILADEKA